MLTLSLLYTWPRSHHYACLSWYGCCGVSPRQTRAALCRYSARHIRKTISHIFAIIIPCRAKTEGGYRWDGDPTAAAAPEPFLPSHKGRCKRSWETIMCPAIFRVFVTALTSNFCIFDVMLDLGTLDHWTRQQPDNIWLGSSIKNQQYFKKGQRMSGRGGETHQTYARGQVEQ